MKTKQKKVQTNKGIPLWGWAAVIVLFIAIVGAVVLSQNQAPAAISLPAEISVTQAAQKRDQGALILDVRELSEWTQFHIPGALLIPLGDLPNRLNNVPKDREIVVVCRSGNRSQTGRDILLKAGYTQVTSMAGGVTQWQGQGLPITTGN
jgi:rhodanese-related sulfurtransferase